MIKNITRIEGYAVVSEDDCIADAMGNMPDSLKNDAEWAFFQAGLDAANVCVMGRLSHDVTPNPKARKRLILTRSVASFDVRSEGVFWNPGGTSLERALEAFETPVRRLAVTGGQAVFDYFITSPTRLTAFHLSRIKGVRIKDGVRVLSAVKPQKTAEDVLIEAGYKPGKLQVLDTGVTVVSWSP